MHAILFETWCPSKPRNHTTTHHRIHLGTELNVWKAWRAVGGANFHPGVDVRGNMESKTRGGHGFRYSREVFVAPMIQTAVAGCGDGEFTSDEEDGFDFTNTCNWSNSNVELDEKDVYERQDSTQSSAVFASLHDSMHSFPPTPGDTNESPNNPSALRKLRRQLLAQHAWSTPSPSEENCYANILSVYQYLTKVECVPSKHVILYGKSVGSGPTCWLTQRLCRNTGNINEEDGNSRSSLSGHCSTDEMCHVESREPQVENIRGENKKEEGKEKTKVQNKHNIKGKRNKAERMKNTVHMKSEVKKEWKQREHDMTSVSTTLACVRTRKDRKRDSKEASKQSKGASKKARKPECKEAKKQETHATKAY